jgi:hypothetical protein
MRHGWIAGALLLSVLAGCEAPRPGFLARLQQDCQSGDQDACGLLAGPATALGPQRTIQPTLRPHTAVQADVDAILQGMDRSRAELRTRAAPDQGG